HTARAHNRIFPHRNSAQQCRAGPDRRAPLDARWDAVPIRLSLKLSVSVRRLGKTVIDEGDVVADEHFVLQTHALADESVARDLACLSVSRTLSEFNWSAAAF